MVGQRFNDSSDSIRSLLGSGRAVAAQSIRSPNRADKRVFLPLIYDLGTQVMVGNIDMGQAVALLQAQTPPDQRVTTQDAVQKLRVAINDMISPAEWAAVNHSKGY